MVSSDLIPFSFDSKEIRVTDQNGDPWFILRDLLDAMESKTTTTAAVESIKQGLGEGFVGDIPLQTAGGTQTVIVVAESAATYLLSRSNTEKGRELNRFIHVEVLPSIRKTGKYEAPAKPEPKTEIKPRVVKEAFSAGLHIAKLCGFTGNHALLSADRCVREFTGRSALEMIGATHLLADERGRTYTPTDLGKMADPPMSGQKVNKAIEDGGMQVRDIKGEWTPLDKADGLFEWVDTGKRHSDGTPIKQMRWFVEVLDRLGIAYQIKGDAA